MSTSTYSNAKNPAGTISGSLSMLYERRWLIWHFVHRQLFRSNRNSFLGPVWLILGPLLMVVLYTLVFSEIIGLRFRETDSVANFGLYLYCGLLPFLAFSDSLTNSVFSVKSNSSLVSRVVFPLEVLPISTATTALITQAFGFGALLLLVVILEGGLHWTLLLFPIIAVPQLFFVFGLSCLATVAGAYVPDLRETTRSFTRAMFFVTPIIWPADRLAEDHPLRFVVDYNPLAFLVQAYRDVVLNGELPHTAPLLRFSLFAVILTLVGFVLFVRVKKRFADLI